MRMPGAPAEICLSYAQQRIADKRARAAPGARGR
jgi:hypothetical protein